MNVDARSLCFAIGATLQSQSNYCMLSKDERSAIAFAVLNPVGDYVLYSSFTAVNYAFSVSPLPAFSLSRWRVGVCRKRWKHHSIFIIL